MLERRHPEFFARAETQLTVNQSVSTSPTNVVVLGPERAAVLVKRHEQIRAKTMALLDAQTTNTGNGQGRAEQPPPVASEMEATVVPVASTDGAPTQEPLPDKPSSWWRPFIFGGALIPKAEASLALRIILGELRIPVTDERALDFGNAQVSKSSFCQLLERLSGSDLGWRTMIQIYERTQARERLWADHRSDPVG
jgi:hypothetical protein